MGICLSSGTEHLLLTSLDNGLLLDLPLNPVHRTRDRQNGPHDGDRSTEQGKRPEDDDKPRSENSGQPSNSHGHAAGVEERFVQPVQQVTEQLRYLLHDEKPDSVNRPAATLFQVVQECEKSIALMLENLSPIDSHSGLQLVYRITSTSDVKLLPRGGGRSLRLRLS